MNKILELREKRAKAWEAAKAFLDTKRGADGLLAAEDVAAYEKMEADVVNLGKEIDRLERQAALDAELAKPVNTPLTGKPAAPSGEEKTGRASAEYQMCIRDRAMRVYGRFLCRSRPKARSRFPWSCLGGVSRCTPIRAA